LAKAHFHLQNDAALGALGVRFGRISSKIHACADTAFAARLESLGRHDQPRDFLVRLVISEDDASTCNIGFVARDGSAVQLHRLPVESENISKAIDFNALLQLLFAGGAVFESAACSAPRALTASHLHSSFDEVP
jgi:hypothetical protein